MRFLVSGLWFLVAVTLLGGCGEKQPPVPDGGGGGAGGGGGGGAADAGDGGDGNAAFTWYRTALPIIQKHCQTCHVAGGIAPFALTTYEEGFLHKGMIADAVSKGRMPPWLPSENCQQFNDQRRMSEVETLLLTGWANSEGVAGNPADAPPPPDAGIPTLPWVDLTLQAPVAYTPPSGGAPDDYRCFLLDPKTTTDRDIIGLDIQPGVRTMVHHAVIFTGPMGDAQALDDADPGVGWPCYGGPGGTLPDGGMASTTIELVGGWVPGMPPTRAPPGTGITLKANAALVMQLHYNLVQGAKPDRTAVKLQFSTDRVPKPARLVPMAERSFQIPPMSTGYSKTLSFTLPAGFNGQAWGVLAHMHTLATKMRITKNGACMLDIPKWDFDWQQFYWYQQPLSVSAGQNVQLTCTWDNPTNRLIGWGEGTADEMCLAYFYVTF